MESSYPSKRGVGEPYFDTDRYHVHQRTKVSARCVLLNFVVEYEIHRQFNDIPIINDIVTTWIFRTRIRKFNRLFARRRFTIILKNFSQRIEYVLENGNQWNKIRKFVLSFVAKFASIDERLVEFVIFSKLEILVRISIVSK